MAAGVDIAQRLSMTAVLMLTASSSLVARSTSTT